MTVKTIIDRQVLSRTSTFPVAQICSPQISSQSQQWDSMHLKCIGYNLKVSYCCDVYIIVLVQTVFHTRCVDKFVLYLCTKFHISNACSSLVNSFIQYSV